TLTMPPGGEPSIQGWTLFSDLLKMAKWFGHIVAQEFLPVVAQRCAYDGVVAHEPRQVPQSVLEHLRMANGRRCAGGAAAGEFCSDNGDARELRCLIVPVDDDEAQNHGAAGAPPGRGMDEQRIAHQIA